MKTSAMLVALVVVIISASCSVLERMPSSFKDSERVEIMTEDGVKLSLQDIVPKRDLIKYPVLLIPDFFLDADEFFTGPQGGLATYLAERGFEVWTIDLRGQGKSAIYSTGDSKSSDWCLDKWLESDIASALSEIIKNSGKDKIILIGHGLGGTLAILAGAEYPDRVAAVISLGSPGGVWRPANRLINSLLDYKSAIPANPVKIQDYLDMPAPFEAKEGLWDILLFNDSGFEGGHAKTFFANKSNFVSPCILRKLSDWYVNGRLLDISGERDFLENFDGLVQPALLIAGKLDHLYCPGEALIAYDSIPSEDKEFFIASRVNRLSVDYGHMGLVMGPNADQDIYRYIVRWVQKRFSR